VFRYLIPDLSILFIFASVSGLPTCLLVRQASNIIFYLSLNLPAAGGFMVEQL
jgi:hypothetical protein